jgi:regulator of protease activity HflC (stomatin/prohibitin superfamily)
MQTLLAFLLSNWLFTLSFIGLCVYLLAGVNIVSEWQRVPVMRFGKYTTTLGPGFTWLEPITNSRLTAIDTRAEVVELGMKEGSSLQTHDNVPIAFVTVLTKQIDVDNVKKFTIAVAGGDNALDMRTRSTVSEVVSRTELNALLHERAIVCAEILALLQARVSDWGIHIIAVELRDVKISDESIQEAIALKARAAKEAEAEMVRAEAQVAIAKELNAAGLALTDAGWRLKSMETMLELCRSAENNTILMPADAISALTAFKALAPDALRDA